MVLITKSVLVRLVLCAFGLFIGVTTRAQMVAANDTGVTGVPSQVAGSGAQNASSTQASKQNRMIVFVGDSLTAGYGVKKEEAFPALIEKELQSKGHAVIVINGGISGSVTAEADRRIKWYLRSKPDIVVIALGANDALKGTPPATIKANLAQAIDLAQGQKIKVLLVGMSIFSNLGPEYSEAFSRVFRELAREKKVALVPFLLEGVALQSNLNQADGKHPNAKGHEILARNVLKELERLL